MPEKVTAQKVSPCGNYIALGGMSGAVYFISLLTGEMLWMRRGHVRAVTCLAFSTPTSSSAGGFHSGSAFLASASADTTCRIIKMGMPTESSTSVVTMTGHSLAVTACAFMKYANRLVSVSSDRTCRISDANSGTVLKVFTASVPLTSVCVGPCDAVVACGGNNGSITFFKQLDNTVTNEEVIATSQSQSKQLQQQGGKKSLLKNTSSRVTSVTHGADIMREGSVLNLAASNNTNNNSNNSNNNNASSLYSSSSDSDVAKVVGPFTGSAEGPILLLGDLFLQPPSRAGIPSHKDDIYFSSTTTGEALHDPKKSSSTENNNEDDVFIPASLSAHQQKVKQQFLYDIFHLSNNTQYEQPNLLAISRDGFVQTFSWSTLSYIKDILPQFRKGITAATIVSPRFVPFASSTLADKPLIQKSALLLKKTPVSAAGARAFLMKALWNAVSNQQKEKEKEKEKKENTDKSEQEHTTSLSQSDALMYYRIRQRDEDQKKEDDILQKHADWLNRVELEVMQKKEEELLVEANELYASKS